MLAHTTAAIAALLFAATFAHSQESASKAWPGEALFQNTCAGCHDGGSPKAPPVYTLRAMSPATLLKILEHGVMKDMAAGLTSPERQQVVEYLTQKSLADYKAPPPPKACDARHARFDLTSPPPPVGWGYDNRRFVPASVGRLVAADLQRLKLKWAFAYPDATQARSQPVVAMGAIFVGSHDGQVFALDLATGCVRWSFAAAAEVRNTIVVESWTAGSRPKHNPRAFFGDVLGNAYAVDAITGKQLWRVRPEAHRAATLTGSFALTEDMVYVPVSSLETGSAEDPRYPCCTFRGSVVALDLATGEMRWQARSVQREPQIVGQTRIGTEILAPSGAPVWGSPTVDAKRGLLYFGTGENYTSPADGNSDAIIAVDLRTGVRRWSHQIYANDAWNNSCMYNDHPNCPSQRGLDQDIATSPMLVDLDNGKQILLGGSKSGVLSALDPDAGGAMLWQTKVGRGSLQGGIHFGMSAEGSRIFVPIYDSRTTPLGGTYDDRGFPGMHMVDANTGKLVWSAPFFDACNGRMPCESGISAASTAIPGAVIAGHIDGWLRAYDRETGKVIWQTDTIQDYTTPNGTVAHGGSMSGPGAAVYQGNLITNSGYGFAFKLPGNALLVYSIDGK
ncbi:polyvinyl alcohol dehydrogenase (cytochrome) [Novosphingobium hassiacum]|uniref:Polyvinyl alcohol dehydrogenase (Cytochrome) n=1 Tax=Novosphingobium hassiacum TaxID=173676 RepID=A0A7W6EXQ7_9SPHN|nr:PQQ-binding-like beta-propeller repeat protein [Novosphingobium hassiacum]MBB3862114.1 polyvinyl alcohol dehydrogenase (cytochrome) [Novosphingobium hassiacum]